MIFGYLTHAHFILIYCLNQRLKSMLYHKPKQQQKSQRLEVVDFCFRAFIGLFSENATFLPGNGKLCY